jgi:hypothetical protein
VYVVDVGANWKLLVHTGAINVHFEHDVLPSVLLITTEPNGRSSSVSKFTNHTVFIFVFRKVLEQIHAKAKSVSKGF